MISSILGFVVKRTGLFFSRAAGFGNPDLRPGRQELEFPGLAEGGAVRSADHLPGVARNVQERCAGIPPNREGYCCGAGNLSYNSEVRN